MGDQTSLRRVGGLNLWTGVILGVTSFLTTYIPLRGKPKPSGSDQPALLRKVGWQLGKLRPRRAKILLITTTSHPSPSLASLESSATTETHLKPAAQNQDQPSATTANSSEEKK